MDTCYTIALPIRPVICAALRLQYIDNPGQTGPQASSAYRASDRI